MLSKSLFLHDLELRQKELKKCISQCQKRLNSSPKGMIHIMKKKSYSQYYLRNDHSEKTGTYITKSNTRLIKSLLQKKYDEEFLSSATSELQVISTFLNKYHNNLPDIYSQYPNDAKKYIYPADMSDADFIQYWKSIPYQRKPIDPKKTEHFTLKGEPVRSKSEGNIANTLDTMGIPYKIEKPLILKNGMTLHPDFTLLDIRTRREIYYEHLGKMDDSDYVNDQVFRFHQYENNGLYIGRDYFVTYETKNKPLNIKDIERTVKAYLNI